MTSSELFDVVVIGDGLVGLATARACARRQLATCLVGKRRPGLGSAAAAGFLAPTVDPGRGVAQAFSLAARDRYAAFVSELQAETGRTVPFALDGILRVPASEREAATMAAARDAASVWVDAATVAEIEPALSVPLGARFHSHDGMVDNQRLLQALDESVTLGGIPRVDADALRVELVGSMASVAMDGGRRLRARRVVIATGAWAPLLAGLPRPIPVRPLRGQMMALSGAPLSRPVFGFGGYLVPRATDRQIFVGSTSEAVGYELGTTDAALSGFRAIAGHLVPQLARADELRSWSGFRPMTFDALPIIGPDPEFPAIIYACGHSRNGVLQAPLTAEVVGALASDLPSEFDLTPFTIARFSTGMSVHR